MPRITSKFATFLIIICGIITFVGRVSESSAAQASSIPSSADSNRIEDEDLVFLAHGVEHHFYLARLDFEEKHFREAADEIRAGTTIMKVEALRASGVEEQNILRSIADLKKLSDRVEKGMVTSVDDLDNSFAHAQILLANRNQQKASRAIESKDYKAAADAHEAAALHLESRHPLPLNRNVSNPEESFHSAREAFLKKDLKTASDEIENGVALLKKEAGREPEERNLALSTSIEELDMLTRDVAKGTITSVGELDEAFRNAHLALAQTYHYQAQEAMNRKDYQTAVEIHRAAAIQFRYLYIVHDDAEKLSDAGQ